MKTQSNKLVFSKNSVLELNDSELNNVSGGSPVTDYIEAITRATTYGTWFDFIF
ncbi:class I lanthipeptide [Lacinutrix sp.]|uniref:class I lanthipeptide n=1 Tax=Lacinutrix sp. TaxID=1937692 RepID=UPI0025C423C7|nr:class I lanthipeptide [Lacinutrix sp.]